MNKEQMWWDECLFDNSIQMVVLSLIRGGIAWLLIATSLVWGEQKKPNNRLNQENKKKITEKTEPKKKIN